MNESNPRNPTPSTTTTTSTSTPSPSSFPHPLPPSPEYTIRKTPNSGHGVFATQHIPTGTHILSTPDPVAPVSNHQTPNPVAWLIQRPYRREVCAFCFAYDRGREFRLRHPTLDCGVVFCSESCRGVWVDWNGDVGVQAWNELELGVKSSSRRNRGGRRRSDDGDGGGGVSLSEVEVARVWADAQRIASVVVTVRRKEEDETQTVSRVERRVLANVVDAGGDPDLMYYLLTAVVQIYRYRHVVTTTSDGDDDESVSGDSIQLQSTSTSTSILDLSSSHPLSALMKLTPTLTAYNAAHTSLALYVSSYQYLLSILPLPLLPLLTPAVAHNLNVRAAHNAFSIRPPASQDGADSGEFLGWGVWPAASFFNHSCEPRLGKRRVGRVFEFFVLDRRGGDGDQKDGVCKGEELCISYLGGEERELDVEERRRRLQGEWGFVCMCARCIEESQG